jgi:predicted ATPase
MNRDRNINRRKGGGGGGGGEEGPMVDNMITTTEIEDSGEQQEQQQQQSSLGIKNNNVHKTNPISSFYSSAHSVATTAATSLSSSGTTTISSLNNNNTLAAMAAGGWRTVLLSNHENDSNIEENGNNLLLQQQQQQQKKNPVHLIQNNNNVDCCSEQPPPPPPPPMSDVNIHSRSSNNNNNNDTAMGGHDPKSKVVVPKKQQIQFSSLQKLYGREKESLLLLQALERTVHVNNKKDRNDPQQQQQQHRHNIRGVANVFHEHDPNDPKLTAGAASTEVVMVSGYSGTGKSALVLQTLQQPCRERYRGCFCFGKFDLHHGGGHGRNEKEGKECGVSGRCLVPFSAISTALSRLVEEIIRDRRPRGEGEDEDHRFDELLRPKLEALFLGQQGPDEQQQLEVLRAIIPNFHLLLTERGGGGGGGDDDNMEAQQQQRGKIISTSSSSTSSTDALLRQCDMVGSAEKKAKLLLLLRLFMKEVCQVYCPVVLHLDDLQWADAASLDLLRALVLDRDITGLLVVGCYRDSDVVVDDVAAARDHHDHKLFTLFLNHLGANNNNNNGPPRPRTATTTTVAAPLPADQRRISETNDEQVRLTTISVQNLDHATIKNMLQDLLQMNSTSASNENGENNNDDADVDALARFVYTKTYGNVFFVIQFLKTLQQMELLKVSSNNNADDGGGRLEWQWDQDKIAQNKRIATADNATELMTLDIEKQLSIPARNALKIAACLGNEFEESMLVLLILKLSEERLDGDQDNWFVWDDDDSIADEDQARELLEQCVQGGFLYRQASCTPTAVAAELHHHQRQQQQQQQQVVSYRFGHDVVQEAAISLIAGGQQDLAHFHIGKVLVENLPEYVQEQNLFALVDMMNHGMKANTLKQTRSLLISLNLKAGKKSLKSSAFEAAVQYITIAVRMLGHDCWDESHYATTLDLFSTAAQAEFCNANPDRCKWYIDRALAQPQGSIQDKFRVYTCMIDYYNFYEKHSEALATSIMVIKQLGVDFGPPALLPFATVSSLLKTKRLLRDMKADDMLGLPTMKDKTKRMAMRLMDRALVRYSRFLHLVNCFPFFCSFVSLSQIAFSFDFAI